MSAQVFLLAQKKIVMVIVEGQLYLMIVVYVQEVIQVTHLIVIKIVLGFALDQHS